MTEHRLNAGEEDVPNVEQDADCGTERHVLVALLAKVRSDRAAYPSTMPMVIDTVAPAMRSLIERRAARIGFDHAFAEDVLHDALLLVATRSHQCRATTDRAAMKWMLSIARSALSNALRHEGPRHRSLDDGQSPADPSQTFDESIGRRAEGSPGLEILLRLVVDAGLTLSAADATLMWMHLIVAEEWATIGAALGISATAARRRFQRAQRSMRRRVHRALWSLPHAERDTALAWLNKQLQEDFDGDVIGGNSGD